MSQKKDTLRDIFKPLYFASRHNFANLEKIRGLEQTLKKCLAKAQHILAKDTFQVCQELLEGLDQCLRPEKEARLRKLWQQIENETSDEGPPEGELPEFPPPPDPSRHKWRREALERPVQFLKGIGPKLGAKLATRDIHCVEDLLYFLPKAYEDRRSFTPLKDVHVGEHVTVQGEIVLAGVVRFKRRKVFEVVISDGQGLLAGKWFYFKEAHFIKTFRPGRVVVFSGEVSIFGGRKEIVHPEVAFPDQEEDLSLHIGRILPVYPNVDGVSPKVLRRILAKAVEEYAEDLTSYIPYEILRRQKLLPLSLAVRGLHFPLKGDNIQALNEGRSIYHKSIAFDEFFFLELALALRRSQLHKQPGIAFSVDSPRAKSFLKSLPFALTRAQKRVLEEIKHDMSLPYPMNRLLQGDVGCGKTVVAFLAALIAIDNGYQVALMAPTEILAEQHYRGFKQLAGLSGIEVELLTGARTPREKRRIYEALAAGHINFIVGTHALFQGTVQFKRLGLVIIDEQHRFGVLQRAALRDKAQGLEPDTLVMTATPIPRTLAMTVYGDLDVSIIDELPAGRKPIKTHLFTGQTRSKAYNIVRQELAKGHRAYIVFPLVEESEKMDLLAATTMAQHLQKEVFPDYKVGLLHGKLPSAEKEAIMQAFKRGEIQILVSTTVIEVGVDVPEATVIVVENAERFGLSQLHQLRGRVGRSARASYCLLITEKLSPKSEAYRRLRILCETNDGFRVAEEDLKIRGPGELLGTKQSGFLSFRRADMVRDYDILLKARQEAFSLLKRDPELKQPEHQGLKLVLWERWAKRLKLSEVA